MCFEIKYVQHCSCSANLTRSGWCFPSTSSGNARNKLSQKGRLAFRQQCVKLVGGLTGFSCMAWPPQKSSICPSAQLALVADCELGSLGSLQGRGNELAARWHMPPGLISQGLHTGQARRIIAWKARGRDVAGRDKDPAGLHLTPCLAQVHLFLTAWGFWSPLRTRCIRLPNILLDIIIFWGFGYRDPTDIQGGIVTIIALVVGWRSIRLTFRRAVIGTAEATWPVS